MLLFTEFSEQSPAELGLPGILWDELLDNAADEAIGHSFIDKLFQRDRGASKGWVIKKTLQDNCLRSKWVKSMNDSGVELNPRSAYRYGLKVEKALELLAVLAHISGGFPLRAWELLVIRHESRRSVHMNYRHFCSGQLRAAQGRLRVDSGRLSLHSPELAGSPPRAHLLVAPIL